MRDQSKTKKQVQFYEDRAFGVGVVFQVKNHFKKIRRSLSLIEKNDPSLFKKVLKIKSILAFPGDDEYGEIFLKDLIWVVNFKTVKLATVVYLASLVVHEAWHIDQYKRGVKNIDSRAERGAYLIQKRFLIAAGDKYSAKWLDQAYGEKWWLDKDQGHKTRPTKNNKQARKLVLEFLKQYKQGKLKIKEIKV